jgi:hypothetical protein
MLMPRGGGGGGSTVAPRFFIKCHSAARSAARDGPTDLVSANTFLRSAAHFHVPPLFDRASPRVQLQARSSAGLPDRHP